MRLPRPALSRHPVRLLALILVVGLGMPSPGVAAQTARKSQAEQAQTQQQLAQIREKMEALAKDQADTAAQRDSVSAALAKQANAVAAAARELRQLDEQLAAKQQALEQLQHQRDALQAKLKGQRQAIAELLRATYTLGSGSDLRLLLGDEDVARIARALTYSKYFQQDRLARVKQLMDDLSRLQQTEASITAEQQALQDTRAQRATQAQALQSQRNAQQKLLSQVNAQYKDQDQQLAALKQNEQSLNQLLAKIQQAIDQAAREAAAAARANPAEPSASEGGKGGADIRGSLPWPAAGSVHSYGNGVLISANSGSEVHAVARGRVVYASFLRGYGMLLILNHGDGWMSMYGNNETLLHKVGDQIEAGQAVGTASAVTGVNTGAYFELRHNGQPVDPRSWLSKRR
ncbi:MAG: peptidoglycan DD-metalloendopeptidase family protein [Dyella sp.]